MTRAREFADLAGSADAGGITGKNVLVNGAMKIKQRALTGTGRGASDIYFIDRFNLNTNGNSAGRYTVSQESDGPSGFAKSMKLACTTADTSIGSSERFFIEQRLEGQNLQSIKKGTSDAEAITVSFYVKGNAAATYVVGIYEGDNSRQIGAQFSVTTSWNRVSVTFPADTGGSALDDDNAESLSLRFYLHAGSGYTSGSLQTTWAAADNTKQVGSGTTSFFDSTSRTFFLTGVQMEVGTLTPFEHESFGVTLQKAMRYYQKHGNETTAYRYLAPAYCNSTSQAQGVLALPVTMRAAPTASVSGNFEMIHGSTNASITLGTKELNQSSVGLEPSGSSFTANSGAIIRGSNDATAQLKLDAEL